jgi:hypothetical protein
VLGEALAQGLAAQLLYLPDRKPTFATDSNPRSAHFTGEHHRTLVNACGWARLARSF